MVPTAVKRILPASVKHPFMAYRSWYWQLRGLPVQSRTDISIFKEVLSKVGAETLKVFEWGSGASTVYYSEFLRNIGRPFSWHSADNSKEWSQISQEKIEKALLTEQVQIHCSEFPAFWELPDYSIADPVPPDVYNNSARVKEYVDFPRNLGGSFEVMIIDGRFRRRCLEVAAEVLSPNGIVILHDASRTHYYPPLSLYSHVQFLKTGPLPGSNHRSCIALASLHNNQLILGFTEKYHDASRSGEKT